LIEEESLILRREIVMFHTLVRFSLYAHVIIAAACFFALSCSAQQPAIHKPHHSENGFKNMHEEERPSFFDFLKWRIGRMGKKIPGPDDYQFPLAENDPAFLKDNHSKTTMTWIGHATVLLQLDGKNILTDPHFSERPSPVQWAGPKRVVQPGLSLEDLPSIDIVVISHDHYDSLDSRSIKRLRDREGGNKTVFFIPLGLKGWFTDRGITRVVESDWWEQHKEHDLTITAVPVKHWSKRTPFSQNTTLWAGWVVASDQFRFFFCGDTGYSPVFREIGEKYGPFDLAAIPIGAYEPRWFMRHHHINPEEAVQVHLDVRSKKSVAIHWGTFILTDEPLDEPPVKLGQALREKNLSPEDFLVLRHGETIVLESR
jgi:N-acyl-phosphatidylethanolamine-hydrolysing phospholipase D